MKVATAIILLGSVALPTAAMAQEQPPAASDNLTTGDIIVTAQKRAERIQDVPLTVVSQSAEQLKSAGIATTQDLTRVVPGLVYAQNEAIAQPAIRGVTATSTGAGSENPIAIYLDGVYQPSPNGVLFDLPDVDHIEVLKGPQGTLFGRNATGGAIQIFTKDPSYTTTGEFTLTGSQYTGGNVHDATQVSVNGYISTPIVSDKVAMSVSGFYRYNPGYMTNDVNNGRWGKQRSYGVRSKLRFDPTDNLKIILSAYYSKLYDQAAYARAPFDGLSVGADFPDAVVPTQPWHVSFDPKLRQEVNLKTYGASMRADLDLDIGTFTSVTGYSRAKNPNYVLSEAIYSPMCNAAFQCLHYHYGTDNSTITQEVNFFSKPIGPLTITSGLFYYHRFYANVHTEFYSGAPLTQLAYFDSRNSANAYAVFGEANIDLTDSLHVIVGGRYSIEKQTGSGEYVLPIYKDYSFKNNAFTPRVSLRYSISRATSIYATWSKGFKSGIMPQPFIFTPGTTPSQAELADATVNPENLMAYEVGIKTSSSKLTGSLSSFYYKYTNMQLIKFVGALGQDVNAGSSKMFGFDGDVAYKFSPHFKVFAGASYIPTAKFTSYEGALFLYPRPDGSAGSPPFITDGDAGALGLRLQRTPKFTGNVGFNWTANFGAGELGLYANLYHSSTIRYDILGTLHQKPYEDLSSQIYYQTGPVRFTIFGKNLLNRDIIAGAQPSSSVLARTWAAPREIGASLKYSF